MRHKSVPEGEYLAVLSVKYSIDPDELFNVLTTIKEEEKIMRGHLSFECRGKSKGGRIFLIRNDSALVAQIRISESFLSEKANPIRKFEDCERIRRYIRKKNACTQKLSAISDLNVGMNRINLNAKVIQLQDPKSIHTRFGNSMVISYALLGDNSGTVKLSLWGQQIGSLSIGDNVQITNAQMREFKGEKQLQIGRNGSLKVNHNSLQSSPFN